jgi:thiol-disulfide isomerase/thioredoxin
MRAWGIVAAILLAAVPHAPLSFTALDGAVREVTLGAGERALVLHFWASWCPDCVDELPLLEHLASRCAASGVRVLFVNAGESVEAAKEFAAAHGLGSSLLLDPKGAVWRRYAPAGLPANLIWTAEGLRAEAGPHDEAAWIGLLVALGCDAAGITSDPNAPPRPPASASPDGTPAPESPAAP